MKIILSRKGFDSSSGKKPSPIFPDGSMVSLPIPDRSSTITYEEISGNRLVSVGELVEQLAGIPQTHRAHLDPDINPHSLSRMKDWRPIFGQEASAESHLRNMGVGPGDVFLFFGLFRSVEKVGSQWHYVRSSQPRHIIFGWLQIAQRIAVAEWPRNDRWALYHPHFARPMANNVIYLAEQHLTLPGINHIGVSGAGVFISFSKELQLTAPDVSSPSRWLLPDWFNPTGRASILSYHSDTSRWKKTRAGTELSSVGRGQEFVLDCDHYPESIAWLHNLAGCSTTN